MLSVVIHSISMRVLILYIRVFPLNCELYSILSLRIWNPLFNKRICNISVVIDFQLGSEGSGLELSHIKLSYYPIITDFNSN